MSDPVADGAARREALDPNRSFIVQAPAGSGKTGLLVQRYLVLLARVEQPEEIVAITFTRKAAAEMRQRILEALALGEREPPPLDKPHQRLTWELAQAALKRDRSQGWRVAQHPSRLRILTIDGLNSAITRLMPVVTGFGAQPGIVEEDVGHLYQQAARAALAMVESGHAWSGAISHILDHLDNHGARAEGLLAHMLGQRELWLRHFVGDGLDREELERSLRQAVEEALVQCLALSPEFLFQEFSALAREAAAFLHANGSQEPWIQAWLERDEMPGAELEEIPAWQGVAFLLLTREGKWRARWTVGEGFPAESSSKNKGEQARLKANKAMMKELVAALDGEETFREALHGVRSLPEPFFSAAQWALLESLGKLLILGVAQLRLLFAQRGEVDHAEVSLQALHALGEPGTPSVAALRLDYRLHHLLVDEFQDTSLSQFRLLERLLEGWTPGDGRTLFLVGDPMQSIYRFRQAEVGLFLRAQREGIGDVSLHPLTLEVNFRSSTAIVDWVNQVFRYAMPVLEDAASGAVSYASSVSGKGADGEEGRAVACHFFRREASSQEELARPAEKLHAIAEARQVARIVTETRLRHPEGSIALLVRSRIQLSLILPELARCGVRYQAVEIDTLGAHPAVMDLAALTRALHHPADRIHWLALLRAPWCGLTLADLLALVGEERETPLPELMGDPRFVARLSADGQQRLGRVASILATALEQRRRLPLRGWVEGVWRSLGGPATLRQAGELRAAEAFFELLEILDDGGQIADFTRFSQRLAALHAPSDPNADGSLQVMTIHKSKGLEFDTVILPGLGRPPRAETQKKLLQWMELGASGELGLLMAPIPAPGEEALYAFIRERKKLQERHESVRLLYVAATRAKSRLHLLGEVGEKEGEEPKPVANTLLSLIWPSVAEPLREVAGGAGEEGRPEAAPWRRLVAGWSPPSPPAPFLFRPREESAPPGEPVLFEWAGEAARMIGVVTHRFLRRIAQEGVEHWSFARIGEARPVMQAHLLRQGMHGRRLEQAVHTVEEALRRTLADERGRWVLENHPQARSELEVGGVLHGKRLRLVVDRAFVDDSGVQWIVDFKTSAHLGGEREAFLDNEQARYRFQLERYAALFARGASRPIRLGLYFPLLQGWREWGWTAE